MSKIHFYLSEDAKTMLAAIRGEADLEGFKALKANTSDGAKEKHVPDIKIEDGRVKVTIGSILHPSTPEHHIEWIALVTEDRLQVAYLTPGEAPAAEFEEVEHGVVYEFCNLHGLWKAEF